MSDTRANRRSTMILADQSLILNNPNSNNNKNSNNEVDKNKRSREDYDRSDNNDNLTSQVNSSNNNNNNNTITIANISNSNNNNNKKRNKKKSTTFCNDRVRSARHCGLPQPSLSFELWELICQHLAPSLLVTLAQVSVGMAAIVRDLPIWEEIVEHAALGSPTTRGFRKTYYGVVVSVSERLCERCFIKCKPSGYEASLKIYDTDLGHDIYLCYSCRTQYFTKHRETYDQNLFSKYQQRHIPHHYLNIIRFYGGCVGYLEELRKNQSIREIRGKNQQTRRDQRRELLVTELNEHNIGYDETSYPFTGYVKYGRPNFETTWQTLVERDVIHHERQTRTNRVKERLAHMNLDQCYLFGLEANQFVKSGDPPLDEVMEVIKVQAQAEQKRKERHQELMSRLQALGRLDETDIKKISQSKECQGYILCGQQHLGEIIGSIVQRLDEQRIVIERQETYRQKVMNLLQDHGEKLDDVAWYCTEQRLDKYANLQSIGINGIIRQIRCDARQKQEETKRREELERRVRGCGLVFDESNYECYRYISRGYGSVDNIVSSLVKWDWVLRETNVGVNSAYSMNYYTLEERVSQAIVEYISKRLMCLKFRSPRDDPCTLARPPMSLWDQIDLMTPEVWRKHAKKCMVEGLLLNSDIEDIISHNIFSHQYEANVTNQMIITAMNRGAIFIASTNSTNLSALNNSITSTYIASDSIIKRSHSANIDTLPLSTYGTCSLMNTKSNYLSATPLFSVALHDILGGEANFNNFLERSREEIIEQVQANIYF